MCDIRKVMTVERLWFLDFNAHIALQVDIQVDMIQVVASKERWSGDLLPETLEGFGQSIMRTYELVGE